MNEKYLKKKKTVANAATASMKQEQVLRTEHSENKKENSEVKNTADKSSKRMEGWEILPENTPKGQRHEKSVYESRRPNI